MIRGVLLALTQLNQGHQQHPWQHPRAAWRPWTPIGLLALGWLTLCPALAMRRGAQCLLGVMHSL